MHNSGGEIEIESICTDAYEEYNEERAPPPSPYSLCVRCHVGGRTSGVAECCKAQGKVNARRMQRHSRKRVEHCHRATAACWRAMITSKRERERERCEGLQYSRVHARRNLGAEYVVCAPHMGGASDYVTKGVRAWSTDVCIRAW